MNSKKKPYSMWMFGVKGKKTQEQQAIIYANKNLDQYLTQEPTKFPNPIMQACTYYYNFGGGNGPLQIEAVPGPAPYKPFKTIIK